MSGDATTDESGVSGDVTTTGGDGVAERDDDPDSGAPTREALAARVADLEERLEDAETGADDGQRKLSIVATKGTLDMAYPPLILATTAAAFDWEVTVFHTFWGLEILHEDHSTDLDLSAVGNPNVPVPNLVAALPGMDRVTTRAMERKLDANDTASVAELVETGLEMGVDFQACQMTVDLLGYDAEDFYDGVTVGVGAATALADLADADVQLLVELRLRPP
jgi:peroxiredoxin family protein